MDQLGLAGILAEVPASVTGLGFVAAIVGGVFVARWCAGREAFAESHVTMGVLGFAALIAVGSLVPGLFFDLSDAGRMLLGVGLALFALGIWMASRETLKGRLVATLCLLYVAVVGVVFWQMPQLYFDSGSGIRVLLLIASTFAVPLSLGRLVAMGLKMEDLSFRLGVVLTAITLAAWPMAKEVVVRAAENWSHEEAVKKWSEGSESYPVTANVKKTLEERRPGLTVHYLSEGKSSTESKSPGQIGAGNDDKAEKPDAPGKDK
tara:strand:- start:2407 stop:3195 length:789 start_codon:yes stop_codon:yes gene_type:complete